MLEGERKREDRGRRKTKEDGEETLECDCITAKGRHLLGPWLFLSASQSIFNVKTRAELEITDEMKREADAHSARATHGESHELPAERAAERSEKNRPEAEREERTAEKSAMQGDNREEGKAEPSEKGDASPLLLPAGKEVKPGCLVVVKIGTSTLLTATQDRMNMNLSNLGKFVDTICELRMRGHTVVVVSSGAVGAGCVTLRLKQRPENLNTKQALAAVGQCRLMRLYEDLFSVREEKVAQVLLSRHDLLHQKSYQNFQAALKALLALDVIPIINENDSLATEQLRFGDNDTLAAHIAVAVDAHWLFILTDVDCLFDRNPHKYPDARPVAFVNRLTDVYAFLSDGACGAWGTGGMYTKVIASKIATNVGVHVAISNGKYPERILDMLEYARRSETTPTCPDTGSLLSLFPLRSPVREKHDHRRGCCRREATQGEATQGEATRGEAIQGEATQGEATQGEATQGEAIQGEAIQGEEEAKKKKEKKLARSCREAEKGAQRQRRAGGRGDGRAATGAPEAGERARDERAKSGGGQEEGEEISGKNLQEGEEREKRGNTDRANEWVHGAHASAEPGEVWGEEDRNPVLKEEESIEVGQKGQEQDEESPGENRAQGAFAGPPDGRGQPFSSLMICDNLQQMPFLGTVFIANDRRLHRKGDTRGWILSLPVRGKIFIDPGAVAALVQQKKSLFAAGVHHVSGEFAANDCVAIYITNFPRGSRRPSERPAGTKGSGPPGEQGSLTSGPSRRGQLPLERRNTCASQSYGNQQRECLSRSSDEEAAFGFSFSNWCKSPAGSEGPPGGQTPFRAMGGLSESTVFAASPCPIECLEIARCISNVSSSELKVIKGRKSGEFRDLLGYAVDEEVAHRQHIVFTFMNGHEALKSFCLAKHAKSKLAGRTEPPFTQEADSRTGE
ncbi:glutamate 5-kinase domain-containing protein [Toxoplasma gondii MAS]|uniref:Glutamate 5-kinase domain-containing protein n=1 Tax=Toxoplasma gondii MAS TaxID=943118 RepID=A0A086Q8P1_TOXGO|nr:glutamate 5-kinase domain-containing protein [Toxoplasma gondii MAS]